METIPPGSQPQTGPQEALPGASGSAPGPGALTDPNAPKPVIPAFWVPSEKTAMEFTNYLWESGFHDQAVRYWNAYLAAKADQVR